MYNREFDCFTVRGMHSLDFTFVSVCYSSYSEATNLLWGSDHLMAEIHILHITVYAKSPACGSIRSTRLVLYGLRRWPHAPWLRHCSLYTMQVIQRKNRPCIRTMCIEPESQNSLNAAVEECHFQMSPERVT